MSDTHPGHPSLELFTKLPLGGVDRRSIVNVLAERGPVVAREDLARVRSTLRARGMKSDDGTCVLMLGGSNGILRALAVQLIFGEGVAVHCVHYDSEKLQIGGHHARAITDAAREIGRYAEYRNGDATNPKVVAETIDALRSRFRRVHLINGIASGAPKRFAEHGKCRVPDLDVAYDPVRQIPDYSTWENVRGVGLVDVDVATPQDVERTNKMMGTSTEPWTDALAEAGLLVRESSIVAFADYDYEPDDPVYAMGPLAGAKNLQRASMDRIAQRNGVRTVRLCYPAMNTTAIGAIPGGNLMFALSAQVLLERSQYKNLAALAADSVALFDPEAKTHELRLDDAYRATLPEFHRRAREIHKGNVREILDRVVGGDLTA